MKSFTFFLTEASQKILNQVKEVFLKNQVSEKDADFYLNYWNDTISKLSKKQIEDLIPNEKKETIGFSPYKNITSFLPTKKTPNPVLSFDDLKQIVDQHSQDQKEQGKTQNYSEDEDIIYNKNNLIIKKGHTKESCIRHGTGTKEDWCISRKDASNLFYGFRFGVSEATFYFVRDLDKPKSDPWNYIVIYVLNDGDYLVSPSNNPGDASMTWKQISEYQPKLKNLQSLFVNVPLTKEEQMLKDKFKNPIEDDDFLKLNSKGKEIYIDLNHELSEKMMLGMFDSKKDKEILNSYVIRQHDIPPNVLKKLTLGQVRKIKENQLKHVKKNWRNIKTVLNPFKETIDYLIDHQSREDIKELLEKSIFNSKQTQEQLRLALEKSS